MTAVRRPEPHDHSPNSSTPAGDADHGGGGDLFVAIAYLVAFLVVCLFALASFVVGFLGR